MFTRIKRKKYRVFAFDIESHNDEESIARGETSMWLGCLIDETSTLEDDVFFSTMDEFIDRLEELSSIKRGKKQGKNVSVRTFYTMHNISKEDYEKGMTYLDYMKLNVESLRIALN